MRWVNTRSLRFANCMENEKRRDARGLVAAVRVVLSNAVLVLREAVLVLEPTAIIIATMTVRSQLIEVSGFRVGSAPLIINS